MNRYIRNVPIEAMQWTGDNTEDIQEWVGHHMHPLRDEEVSSFIDLPDLGARLWGGGFHWFAVNPGDWVLRGEYGFYRVPDEEFSRTYEPEDDGKVRRLQRALSFAKSVIKSGEPWSPVCEEVIGAEL